MTGALAMPTVSAVLQFLELSGWSQVGRGPLGTRWMKRDLKVSVPIGFGGDLPLAQDVIARISRVEDEDFERLWVNLLFGISDVLETRLVGNGLDSGYLPLAAAADAIASARRVISSAGTSVMTPMRSINGRYRPEAQRIAKEALLAHTRPGSFVFPLYIRLDVERDGDTLAHPGVVVESFPRQVTRRLAESLATIRFLLREYGESPVGEEALGDAVATGVSRELCKSIDVMLRSDAILSLDFQFDWAKTSAPPPNVASYVAFDRSMRPALKRIATQLSTPGPERAAEFTGVVTDVHQPANPETDDDYHFSLATYHQSRPISLRVEMPASSASAAEWFRDRSTVLVRGQVVETPAGFVLRHTETVKVFVADRLRTDV